MADATDTFTEGADTLLTSHTSDSGHTWALQSGSSGNGNVLAATDNVKDNAGNAPNIYSSVTPASAEYDVQLDTTGAGDCSGPSGRVETGTNTSYFAVYNNGASEWRLIERIAGVSTTLGTATIAGGAPDPASGVVTVLLEIRTASKKVFLNGVERISHTATDDITAAGKPGIKFAGVTSDRMDNWSFTNFAAAASGAPWELMMMGVGR